MNILLGILALILLVPTSVLAERNQLPPPEITLPDIEPGSTETEVESVGRCDKGESTFLVHKGKDFQVVEVRAKNGFIFYLYKRPSGKSSYFLKDPRFPKPAHIDSRRKWENRLDESAPNYYARYAGMFNDCNLTRLKK